MERIPEKLEGHLTEAYIQTRSKVVIFVVKGVKFAYNYKSDKRVTKSQRVCFIFLSFFLSIFLFCCEFENKINLQLTLNATVEPNRRRRFGGELLSNLAHMRLRLIDSSSLFTCFVSKNRSQQSSSSSSTSSLLTIFNSEFGVSLAV